MLPLFFLGEAAIPLVGIAENLGVMRLGNIEPFPNHLLQTEQ
jgi:hypothetical protein